VGCCECGDEPSGSGATELVSNIFRSALCFKAVRQVSSSWATVLIKGLKMDKPCPVVN
jgi:hypothetical protein